jgi:Kelch motif
MPSWLSALRFVIPATECHFSHAIRQKLVRSSLAVLMPMAVLLVSAGLSGCTSASTAVPPCHYVFDSVDDRRIRLVNEQGQELDWRNSRDDLSSVADVVFDDIRLGPTSAYRRVILQNELVSWLDKDQKLLELPVHGNSQQIVAWSALELRSGEILIVGGGTKRKSNIPDGMSWVIDPTTNSIRQGGKMCVPRNRVCLTMLHDGRVLASGGWCSGDGNKISSACEMYDPKTNTFASLGNMHIPRAEHAVVELKDDLILIAGGLTIENSENNPDGITRSVEVLELKDQRFTSLGCVHEGRFSADLLPMGKDSAVLVGGLHFDWKGDIRRVWTSEIFTPRDH